MWSQKDRFPLIELSDNGLRAIYKGLGKSDSDAAAIRANRPIPASCGIFYFEIKIISKGRDGYIGIGLSADTVNLNRLPGWERLSFGYHGDDGNMFRGTGTGQPYGPTFTTGDVIGLCYNLTDYTVFYTKNGTNLGIAFRDVAPPMHQNLHPTVGMRTPGEIVEANFGQSPFIFDFEGFCAEQRAKASAAVRSTPVPLNETALTSLVLSWLVHHAHTKTAAQLAAASNAAVLPEFTKSIATAERRRQICQFILSGDPRAAFEAVVADHPRFTSAQPSAHLHLLLQQFIEKVSQGLDTIEIVRFAQVFQIFSCWVSDSIFTHRHRHISHLFRCTHCLLKIARRWLMHTHYSLTQNLIRAQWDTSSSRNGDNWLPS
eukprot:TRINITY_DN1967_c0_g1_i1.p1 TRINITY_DN1967_c0_g1~~TRINITY_DN1967_c0_g1_i1.p1  ORF type:complete len:374 (-),score=50.63 TRINITY_DN1967_c0_g1_i1:209-1330(-)